MQKTNARLKEIKIVGITARTNNTAEMNPAEAKIGTTMKKYFHEGWAEKIHHRKNPGKTFCVYTNYENDFNGDYTYFIGEEVTHFDEVVQGLETLAIPAQAYAKFTNEPGPMPAVCIDMWQHIWKMKAADFGSERTYNADFEVYDERSQNLQNAILDIYIGIKK